MNRILITLLCALLLNGCLRGESRSLDEIYDTALGAFNDSESTGLPADVSQHLEKASSKIKSMVAEGGMVHSQTLHEISAALTELLPRAGYTVRPALTELRNQYAGLEQFPNVTSSQVKLLGARTLSLLADELNSTKFGL